MSIRKGDIVGRRSYGCDVHFTVEDIYSSENGREMARLKGVEIRLCADAPVEDLETLGQKEINEGHLRFMRENAACMRRILSRRKHDEERYITRNKKINRGGIKGSFFNVPGRVLHLDGDPSYLTKCMDNYQQLNIEAYGFAIPEAEQPKVIIDYLRKYQVDIVVLTGHDALIKNQKDFKSLDSYRNSRYFVEAVREARSVEPSLDDLVIFAGACQSHYEAILAAGANFASSPQRILIHAFDPVFVVEKISYSSIHDILSIDDIIDNTITGMDGIGGVETKGRLRIGYPKSPY
ncbi:MAG: sporulation peptidase YabG [Bacillota bacterium]|nr:sporulation peptidase YabG [Bacillota bacterium]